MRNLIFLLLSIVSFMAMSQNKITLTVGNKSMTATLADNEATRTLVSMLEEDPITIEMNDYGGFEKVGALPRSLPTSNSQITAGPGDIMLYQGNNMVVFYGTNSWSYTRLGKIDGASTETVRHFLGSGGISLTISLDSTNGIEEINADDSVKERVSDLNGNQIASRPLPRGVYIINGRKKVIKH